MVNSPETSARCVDVCPGITAGADAKLLFIAGPCQIESRAHCVEMAARLKEICSAYPVNLIFKSSFDKANRTGLNSTRGPGIVEGLKILQAVKKETGLPLITDVHTTEQVTLAAQTVDILQTPAFLCRQTDFLVAVGAAGKAVNIKKGQFLHPADMKHAADKVSSAGGRNILLCERGTCFGYRDLVVDMRSLIIMKEIGYPVIFDATHSVQSMGGKGDASGGSREYVLPLARAAVAIGVDGLFVECHDNPDKAPSDGPSMLPLNEVQAVLDSVCKIREGL
ncbi:3-deoxy-8-phosphooctulonate synthase [Oligoflexia bacterium]|nr:3-deoxy-8-phosphooctulonate synthase [Oligoflexia bacterium]